MLTTPSSSKDLTSYSIDDMNKNFKHLNNGIISIAKTLGNIQLNFSEDKQKSAESYNNIMSIINQNKHTIDFNLGNVNSNLESVNIDLESLNKGLNLLSDTITNLNVDGKITYLDNKISVLENNNNHLSETNINLLETNKNLIETNKNLLENNKNLVETNKHILHILNYLVETNNIAFLSFDKKIDELSNIVKQNTAQQNNGNVEMMLMGLDNNINMLFVDNKKNSSKIEFIVEKLNNLELKIADYADKIEHSMSNDILPSDLNNPDNYLKNLNDNLDDDLINQSFSSNLLKTLNIIQNDNLSESNLPNTENNDLPNTDSVENNDLPNTENNDLPNKDLVENKEAMLLLERLSVIYESMDAEIIDKSDDTTRSRVVPDEDSNVLKYVESHVPEHNFDTEKIDINDFKLCNILVPPEDRFKADDEIIKLAQPKKKRGKKQ